MNSAFPRISQPVSSDRRRSRINGVFPTYPSIPEYVAVMRSEFLREIVKPLLVFRQPFFAARNRAGKLTAFFSGTLSKFYRRADTDYGRGVARKAIKPEAESSRRPIGRPR